MKISNITRRSIFNYIKISQDDSIGFENVPSKFMEIINNACRRGTTVWHNHANIGDYSLNNTIV